MSLGFQQDVLMHNGYQSDQGEAPGGPLGPPDSRDEFCKDLRGLSKGQSKLCLLYEDHMPHVGRGALMGIEECQYQFRDMKWNCSTTHDDSVLGPVLNQGSKETAFAHAIAAAGVVHTVARACRDGNLRSCGCSNEERPNNLHKEWIWGGCGDNIAYGYRFTEGFVDLPEREQKYGKNTPQQGKKLMNLHNNEVGRRGYDGPNCVRSFVNSKIEQISRRDKSVIRAMRLTCKCHGVSGSCSVITCWKQLSPFRAVGEHIRNKYDLATQVKLNKRGRLQVRSKRHIRTPTADDLIFIKDSPDYCTFNSTAGSFGTRDRRCNKASNGPDGCSQMCCGRGYTTKRMKVKERCKCKFQWCCYVECKTCTNIVEITTCK
ncbi:protein Wnt-5b-like isoform X2 [Varroa destructor]|uniref:Protein Wnt n=1 Tax=Varroa destructor TaxID=109461 RepID=A0A7M7JHW6_VARDE|nr:protein Wnt-5b-like isoform X2 [Varroa destructor]